MASNLVCRGQGHSTGITSSKNPAIYSWMLAIAREGEDVEETGDEDAEEADDDSAE